MQEACKARRAPEQSWLAQSTFALGICRSGDGDAECSANCEVRTYFISHTRRNNKAYRTGERQSLSAVYQNVIAMSHLTGAVNFGEGLLNCESHEIATINVLHHAWLKAALSPLQFQLAHEIAFSKRRAIDTEDVVSRGRMEKEVPQR